MGTSIRRFFVVVFVASLMVGLLASGATAFGAPVEFPPGVSSTTNLPLPSWHWGWGNTLTPDFTLSFDVAAYGVFYVVDRSASRPMSSAEATMVGSPYSHSLLSGTTMFTSIVAIQGTYDSPPAGGWPAKTPAMTDPREGYWYLHALPYSYDILTGTLAFGTQVDAPIAIDLTPPTAPTGVVLSPGSTSVVGTSRVRIFWNGLDYDRLSGTAYYSIFDNGERIVSGVDGTKLSKEPSSPPIWYDPSWPLGYDFTIEDLSAGPHEFYVTATDRATNEGPKSASAFIVVDPDAPTITLTTPDVSGPGAFEWLTATAVDSGGVRYVDWWIDSTYLGRSTGTGDAAAPSLEMHTIRADTGSFVRGYHTVIARVTDEFGRTAVARKSMRIIGSSSRFISAVTDSPDPFFPNKRDGYKDDSIVRFTLYRRAMVWMLIYDSAGNRVRLVTSTWKNRGRRSLKWDGKLDDGKTVAADGTYRIYVGADDGRGNVYFSRARTTKLRSFIVQRLGHNRVRLLFR
jgi:hypothetical protein